MARLKDQIAIITGGARGIGKAVCTRFAAEGAKVVIWDVVDGEQTAAAINESGGSAVFRKTDITNREDVALAAQEVISQFGKIEILINNAGIIRDRSFSKMSFEEWDGVLNVNLSGTFNATKAVVPHMREAGYGRIVSASSINGSLGAFGQTNYAASKAGIVGFTKSLAKEVGKYGITANVVAPGFIETEMTATMPKEVVDFAIMQIPVKRIGQPEDMAACYLFLASPEASFVNGHTLHANGGSY